MVGRQSVKMNVFDLGSLEIDTPLKLELRYCRHMDQQGGDLTPTGPTQNCSGPTHNPPRELVDFI
jgi:hypothetical protein